MLSKEPGTEAWQGSSRTKVKTRQMCLLYRSKAGENPGERGARSQERGPLREEEGKGD